MDSSVDADHLPRDHVSNYWLNFVRTSDTNGTELPVSSTFADVPEQVMRLGLPSGMTARPRSDVTTPSCVSADRWLEHCRRVSFPRETPDGWTAAITNGSNCWAHRGDPPRDELLASSADAHI
jgi:hypothetical protein